MRKEGAGFNPEQFAVEVVRNLPTKEEKQSMGSFIADSLKSIPDRQNNLPPTVRQLHRQSIPGMTEQPLPREFGATIAKIRGIGGKVGEKEDPAVARLQTEYESIREKGARGEFFSTLKSLGEKVKGGIVPFEEEWAKIPKEENNDAHNKKWAAQFRYLYDGWNPDAIRTELLRPELHPNAFAEFLQDNKVLMSGVVVTAKMDMLSTKKLTSAIDSLNSPDDEQYSEFYADFLNNYGDNIALLQHKVKQNIEEIESRLYSALSIRKAADTEGIFDPARLKVHQGVLVALFGKREKEASKTSAIQVK